MNEHLNPIQCAGFSLCPHICSWCPLKNTYQHVDGLHDEEGLDPVRRRRADVPQRILRRRADVGRWVHPRWKINHIICSLLVYWSCAFYSELRRDKDLKIWKSCHSSESSGSSVDSCSTNRVIYRNMKPHTHTHTN